MWPKGHNTLHQGERPLSALLQGGGFSYIKPRGGANWIRESQLDKKALIVGAALMALPVASQAQSLQYPGFYMGAEGGGNWMFNTSAGTPLGTGTICRDRIYRNAQSTVGSGPFNNFGMTKDDIGVLANVLYDFNAGSTIVPYIGAGAGVAFVKTSALGLSTNSTQFAYQAIVGAGYNIDPMFRVNLDARYYSTTAPNFVGNT